MTTKKDFEDFFENSTTGSGCVICKFDFESRENFTALIRCKLVDCGSDVTIHNYQAFIKSFVCRYSVFTHSGWIVRKTFPNMKKLIYRKIYTCQHSSFNKKNTETAQRKIFKGNECDAKLDFLIKIINKNTCKNDAMLRNGYNIIVHIKHQHTHPIHVKEALSLLKSDPKLDAEFFQYFESGMTPAVAKIYHETKIMDAHHGNFNEILSNAHINPADRHINYLYSKWRQSKRKNRWRNDFDQILVKIEPRVSIEVKVDEEKNSVEDMPFRLSEPYSLADMMDEDFGNSLEDFNREMARLSDMFVENQTSDTLNTMKKLTGHLRNIKTVADVRKIVFCDIKRHNRATMRDAQVKSVK